MGAEEVSTMQAVSEMASTGVGGILLGAFGAWFFSRRKNGASSSRPTTGRPTTSKAFDAGVTGAIGLLADAIKATSHEQVEAMRGVTDQLRRLEEGQRAVLDSTHLHNEAQHQTALILQGLVAKVAS